MKLLLISLLAASALMFDVSCEEKFRFDNYKLVRLFPTTPDHVRFVQQLEDLNVDVWAELLVGEKKSVDIMLSPEEFGQFTNVFRRKKLNFEVVNDNIQNLIDLEAESMKQSAKNSRSIIFRYARYSEVLNYIDEMVEKNSDIASSQIIGTTHEGRILKIIKLRKGNPTKSVWIDCGIHAREWVSPSSCVFIIHQLIDELRNSDSVVSALFDKYDFHILPLHNPDGYEFTHTVYRLWRKNRRPNAGSTCFGIDLNRNFPSYWLTGGSTLDPCSDIHAGPYVASEKETQAVMKYIKDRKGQWDSFLNIHSYGNWWLTSYGHTPDELPPDHQLMMDAAIVGCEAIKSYNGSVFIPGPSSQLLYVVTGGSADWAYLEMGVRYSYVLELRPGQGTPDYSFGFILPEDRMPLVATETYLGIKAFLNYISKL